MTMAIKRRAGADASSFATLRADAPPTIRLPVSVINAGLLRMLVTVFNLREKHPACKYAT